MNKLIVFIAFMSLSTIGFSQIQVQPFFGNDGLQIGSLINKTFSKNEKWNYFNYTSYFTEYKNVKAAQIESYQNVSYTFYKNIGFNVGTSFGNTDLSPSIGLSYILEKDKFNMSIFPSINYSIAEKEISADINSMLEYTPSINKDWNFYSMLIFNADFGGGNAETKEFIRIGLEHKNKFQFGIGTDIDNNTKSVNFGGFIGYTFQN